MSNNLHVCSLAQPTKASVGLRLLLGILLTAAALQGSGVRIAAAQDSVEELPAFRLDYVPRDVLVVAAMRPAVLAERPAIVPFAEAIRETVLHSFHFPVSPEEMTQVHAFVIPSSGSSISIGMKIHTTSATAADKVVAFFGADSEPSVFMGNRYQHAGRNRWVHRATDRMVLIAMGGEVAMCRYLAAGKTGAAEAKWADRWEVVATSDAATIANTSLIRAYPADIMSSLLNAWSRSGSSELGRLRLSHRISPLWTASSLITAKLNIREELRLEIEAESNSDHEAKLLQSATLTALSLGRILSSHARERVLAGTKPSPIWSQQIDHFDRMLENAVVNRDDSQVSVSVVGNKPTMQAIASIAAPLAEQARVARTQNRSVNNLKMLGVAFHNYHDTFGTFPRVTQAGLGQTPHSWRVALLPFLGEPELYDKYRLDEPWDSRANLKLLDEIPAVYRCPLDKWDSTNTSYFVLDGPRTAMHSMRGATRFSDILDGTSNTLMVVESKRSVPWTKPEDIPFDFNQPPPKLGGWYADGFNSAFCDGYVRKLPNTLEAESLKRLIMRDDGKVIDFLRR